MFNPYAPLLRVLSIEVPLLEGETLLQERTEQAAAVCQRSGELVSGILTWDEYLESLEIWLPDMDVYIEEIAENLEALGG